MKLVTKLKFGRVVQSNNTNTLVLGIFDFLNSFENFGVFVKNMANLAKNVEKCQNYSKIQKANKKISSSYNQ